MFTCIYTGIIIKCQDQIYTTDLFYNLAENQFGINTPVKIPSYQGPIQAEIPYLDPNSYVPYELGVREFHYCEVIGFNQQALDYIGKYMFLNPDDFKPLETKNGISVL